MPQDNPFRPGAGHMPPYLAGRTHEQDEFAKLLDQSPILQNVVLTGLRGIGKTVLMETFRAKALETKRWLWVGTDLSESTSITEEKLALRIITDLSVKTTQIVIAEREIDNIGFSPKRRIEKTSLNFDTLWGIYSTTPGLPADKLKSVLEIVWRSLPKHSLRGIVFGYDEAQNLADHAEDREYPLSLLLDVFQSIQKRGVMFMLVLVGLSTLFPKLVAARTDSERMFRVIALDRLTEKDSKDAIIKPIAKTVQKFSQSSIDLIAKQSAGYPYFIQFFCREVYDLWNLRIERGEQPVVPMRELLRKLDTDFFAGRWSRVTDRQRELLLVIAKLATAEGEFTVQEIVEGSLSGGLKPFNSSHVSQMLNSLSDAGLIYKNRHGKYLLAVPLLNQFILRQSRSPEELLWGDIKEPKP